MQALKSMVPSEIISSWLPSSFCLPVERPSCNYRQKSMAHVKSTGRVGRKDLGRRRETGSISSSSFPRTNPGYQPGDSSETRGEDWSEANPEEDTADQA